MQSRPDRDDYVEILWDNIQENRKSQFFKCDHCPTFNVPYDALSFMHYEAWAFPVDSSKPVMESKVFRNITYNIQVLSCHVNQFQVADVPTNHLGLSAVLTMSDNLLLRRMYGCSK